MVLGCHPQEKRIPALTERSQLDSKSHVGTVRGGGIEGKLKEKWKNKKAGQAAAWAKPLYCHGLARLPYFMAFDLHLC